MNLEVIREFFGWMTLINLGMYMWTALACVVMKAFVVRISSKWFGVNEEAGKNILFGYVGMYKLLFLVFNLVPWLALTIMT